MTKDFINKNGNFIVKFLTFNGSGWDDQVEKIITSKLSPIDISKRTIEESIDYSEKEFDLVKDDIKFIFHLDDLGSTYLLLAENVTNENKQKLRDWATIIAEEVEK